MATPLRYLGFSGGGWNTHTVSSGMMSAALQMARERGATDGDFGLLLNNFNGAAGNSGGSWFLTMLSYSPGFADALANQADDWFTSGYMGQQRQIFQPNATEAAELIKRILKEELNKNIKSTSLYQALNSNPLVVAPAKLAELFLGKNDIIADIVSTINNGVVDLAVNSLGSIQALQTAWNEYGLYPTLLYLASQNNFNWLDLVKNTAYSPYGMSTLMSRGFNEINRNPWATSLQLILPGAFNNTRVSSFGNLARYYTTSATSNSPELREGQLITPMSMVIGGGVNPTNKFTSLSGSFEQQFNQFNLFSNPTDTKRAALNNELNLDLSIIEAATLSGAFAGDISSINSFNRLIKDKLGVDLDPESIKSQLNSTTESLLSWIPPRLRSGVVSVLNNVLDGAFDATLKPIITGFSSTLSRAFSNFAVPVSLSGGVARYENPENFKNLNELTNAQNYRFIDGGYVDNTTVANIVSEIQREHGVDQDFDLTFFVNNTDPGIIPKEVTGLDKDFTVPIDLAKLFGGEGSLASWQSDSQVRDFAPFNTPAAFPYIFDRSAWQGEKPVWQWDNSDEWQDDEEKATYLAYYKLDVETIDNPYFAIKEKQKGELNIFTSYNLSSGPGPYDPSFFNLYENIYQATREGIINKGGYVHLLSAMNVMNLESNEQGQLSFTSDEELNHSVQIDLDQVDTDYLSLIDIYKLTADGQRIYSGSLGGSDEEAPFEYDNGPQALMMNAGDSLEFEIQTKNSPDPIQGSIQLQETDNGYQLLGLKTGDSLFSATASFAPVIDGKESVSDDDTARDSSDDTYFSFTEGTRLKIAVNAIAAMTNRFSIIKIDRDPITGEASYLGSAIDSSEMNDLLINTFGQEQSGTQFGSKTLNPYSQREFTWTVEETGLFAPVLLTEEGGIFALGHDLIGESTHTRILGDYTVGFEDQYDRNSDYDYNDAIVKFEAIA
ncbi:hypothetical protein SynWH8101_0641 [Synechococcus sp. WH 8101]|uniref:DUF4114 domain-containing protein n=1 Tax=Synechococcus sp. WH 8101 TaxID=59932 RepID=UPI0010239D04|nr:DUF4114 domain-containing protein [Synechococcus sp. WH 8101]QBE68236.1 hypothetical protein SynWH8101_0641 [Synechococcus sp. WH 8101]QNI44447.1 hypothetical protein SynRCC2555_00653 [Synechococcus sp. WH 8101]